MSQTFPSSSTPRAGQFPDRGWGNATYASTYETRGYQQNVP